MKDRYDVIVVGAGPAGSVAAKAAADKGLSVLLLEKRQEIGEPVRCAEGITRRDLLDFLELDPKWTCAGLRKARFFSQDETCLEFKGESPAAYILERKIFDRELARRASQAGADVFTKTQATGLMREGGTVTGIKGKCLGDDFQARAGVVVAADGFESRVARWGGIDTCLNLKDIGSCAQFRLTGVDADPECCEFYFGSRWAPGGYAWVFPKGPGEANVGLGIIGGKPVLGKPIEYLRDFAEWRFPGAGMLETVAGAVPISGRIPRLSAGGLVLVGDAGRLCDPMTGEGIANGMISGRIAGEVIADCISSGDVSAKALLRYDREIDRRLGAALNRNYMIKERMRNASDRRVNLLFRAVKAMKVEAMPMAALLKEVYEPRSRRVASLLRMLSG